MTVKKSIAKYRMIVRIEPTIQMVIDKRIFFIDEHNKI